MKNLREVQKLIEHRHLSFKYYPIILGLDTGGRNLTLIYPVLLKLLNDQLFCFLLGHHFFGVLQVLP